MISVPWKMWRDGQIVGYGYSTLKEVSDFLKTQRIAACKLLKETGCAHVVYGAKYLDSKGGIREFRYYMKPMTEREFEAVKLMKDVLIYAVHRR